MFPPEFRLDLLVGKGQLHQFILAYPCDYLRFDGFPYCRLSVQKNAICAHERTQQHEKEEYGKAFSQGGVGYVRMPIYLFERVENEWAANSWVTKLTLFEENKKF